MPCEARAQYGVEAQSAPEARFFRSILKAFGAALEGTQDAYGAKEEGVSASEAERAIGKAGPREACRDAWLFCVRGLEAQVERQAKLERKPDATRVSTKAQDCAQTVVRGVIHELVEGK